MKNTAAISKTGGRFYRPSRSPFGLTAWEFERANQSRELQSMVSSAVQVLIHLCHSRLLAVNGKQFINVVGDLSKNTF
jgi:hypothetical protein